MAASPAPTRLTPSRLALIVAFILLLIAALLAFGAFRGPSAEGFALLGLASWALSGALA